MGLPASKPQDLVLPQQLPLDLQRKASMDQDMQHKKWEYAWSCGDRIPPSIKSVDSQFMPGQKMTEFIRVKALMTSSEYRSWNLILEDQVQSLLSWVAGNKEKLERNPWAMHERVWVQAPPEIVRVWKEDIMFTDLRLNGMFPWHIKEALMADLWRCSIDEESVEPVLRGTRHTLASLEASGRLFVVDLDYQHGITTNPDTYCAAPIELFYVDDDNTLQPLAIQLSREGHDDMVWTPRDPPTQWLAAKIHANSADLQAHGFFVHLIEMHQMMETVWLAAVRNLTPRHPLLVCLEPHFSCTMFVNQFIRQEFDTGDFPMFAPGKQGAMDLIRNAYETYSFDRLHLPTAFPRRGVHRIPGFYYAEESMLHWEVNERYMRALLGAFYKTDADVAGDFELIRMLGELSNPAVCNVKGMMIDPARPETVTLENLVQFATTIIHTIVTQHSYVENAGLRYYGFVAGVPAYFRYPIPTSKNHVPTEEELVACLPELKHAVRQVAMIDSVHMFPDNFAVLKLSDAHLKDAPTAAKAALRQWKEDMGRLEETLLAAKRPKAIVKDSLLLPSRSAYAIWN